MSLVAPPRHVPQRPGAARASLRLLWWLPLSMVVGFVAGSWLIAPSWPLWQVVPLALVLSAPYAAGVHLGLRAIRDGDRRGWIGLVPHLALLLVALVMPTLEALTH